MPHETPPQAPQPNDPWNQAPISMHEHLSSVYETQNDIDHLVLETRQKPAEAARNGHDETVQAEARQAVEQAYARQTDTDKLVGQAEELFASVASTNIQNVKDHLPAPVRKGHRRATRPADASAPAPVKAEQNLPEPVPSEGSLPPVRKGHRRATRPADASAPAPSDDKSNLPVPVRLHLPVPVRKDQPLASQPGIVPTPQPAQTEPSLLVPTPAPQTPEAPLVPQAPEVPQPEAPTPPDPQPAEAPQPSPQAETPPTERERTPEPEQPTNIETRGERLIDRISNVSMEARNGTSQLVINDEKRIYSIVNGHGRGNASAQSADIAAKYLEAFFDAMPGKLRKEHFKHAYEMAAQEVAEAANKREIKEHAYAGISGASLQFFQDDYGHLHATYAQLGSGTMFRERTITQGTKSYSEITMLSNYKFENRVGPNYTPGAWEAGYTDELLEGDRIIIADRNLFSKFADRAEQVKQLKPLVATEDMDELLYNLAGKNPGADQSIIVIGIGVEPTEHRERPRPQVPAKRPGRTKRVVERLKERDRARYDLDDDHFETPETDEPTAETEGRQSRAARLVGKLALRDQRRSRYAINAAGRRSSFGMSPNNAQLRYQQLAQAEAEARAQAEMAEQPVTEVEEPVVEQPFVPLPPEEAPFLAPQGSRRIVDGFETEEDHGHPRGKLGVAGDKLRRSGGKARRMATTGIKRGVQKRVQARVEKSRADSSL
jgi:hypothetical protein